jgi:hypothetical protein
MDKLISEANSAKKQIKALNEQEKRVTKKADDQIWKLESEKRDKVYKIEDEYREKINYLESAKGAEQALIKTEREKLYSTVSRLDRIFKLKEIADKKKKDIKIDLVNFDGRALFIQYLYGTASKYLEAKFFIKETDKPKNKYALVLVGDSIFTEVVIRFPRDYSATQRVSVKCGGNYESLAVVIKEAPTADELRVWFEKKLNDSKTDSDIFWNEETLKEFKKTIEEYEWVVANCNTPEWEMAYLGWKKEYFERNYSNYEAEAEYKRICKKLAVAVTKAITK